MLPDYQLRVIEEKEQLDLKISKLASFLFASAGNCVLPEEGYDLISQHQVMLEYSSILTRRISRFKPDDHTP